MGKPLILITPDWKGLNPEEGILQERDYLEGIEAAGGIPIVSSGSRKDFRELLGRVEGVVIPGGDFDIPPRYYREKPKPGLGRTKPERTEYEVCIFRRARRLGLPILGICGGMQLINVGQGGSLYQDLSRQVPRVQPHKKGRTGKHPVRVAIKSKLYQIMRKREIEVNTTHHQGINRLGRGLVAVAHSGDGIIEAIEADFHPFILGVQWHPERMRSNPEQRRIFSVFIQEARKVGKQDVAKG